MNWLERMVALRAIRYVTQRVLKMDFLRGKKTYLLAFLGAVTYGLQLAGVIDPDLATKILTFLGIGGAATLRAGMK